MKGLRQTGTMACRGGAHIFMFSLSLHSRHKWMIINDIISYQTLSMSAVIERIWRLHCFPMENKRPMKCDIISSTWTNGLKAKEFSR